MEFTINNTSVIYETKPDLFSPKKLDSGTELLLKYLATQKFETILDWGCGWGAIGLYLAKHNQSSQVFAIDANIGAIATTKQNIAINNLTNITVVASDSYDNVPSDVRFDLIVANPPTHQGREVVDAMIVQSRDWLNADGKVVLVVEARLKPWVARIMKQTYGECRIINRSPKHVVLEARNSYNNGYEI